MMPDEPKCTDMYIQFENGTVVDVHGPVAQAMWKAIESKLTAGDPSESLENAIRAVKGESPNAP